MGTIATTDSRAEVMIESARALRPLIESLRDEMEAERRMPQSLVQAMLDARLFHLHHFTEGACPVKRAYGLVSVTGLHSDSLEQRTAAMTQSQFGPLLQVVIHRIPRSVFLSRCCKSESGAD